MLLLALLLEILSNADIVKLVKAGLSPETIEAKIAVSSTKFDTSTDALVALVNDGVPDRVIRTMVKTSTTPKPAAAPSPAPPVKPSRVAARRYEVAIHRDEHAKCDGGELIIDANRVKGSRCRELDFDLKWEAIRAIEYEYGFRGVIVFKTEKGEHRVSTLTPAEAKKIVEQLQKTARHLVKKK